jgi:hypothetical protein
LDREQIRDLTIIIRQRDDIPMEKWATANALGLSRSGFVTALNATSIRQAHTDSLSSQPWRLDTWRHEQILYEIVHVYRSKTRQYTSYFRTAHRQILVF